MHHGGSFHGAPQHGPGPGGWGPPAHAPALAPTVAKASLMQGERVLYFWKPDLGMARVWYFIGGLVLLPVLVGIYLLYVGVAFEEKANHYWVVTNMRLFTVNARGKVLEQIANAEITNLVHRVGAGKNALIVEAHPRSIMFRIDERHDLARLKPLLQSLRNPTALQQLPSVPFEP